ncbi:5-(carboxyamino)imidazole ribonucleotide synthase [Alphaproteobacteria bacterium KMM 3653]|uniref:N5-carboxyaminoimidazole ribonucleotide synthase n=1 Tax=Harenicola maris TaxID=2841044 RepID=A0AAP2CPF6_9RHOB|nr:5-(carboxyamino)imidazole ribonucleotide synthase [Harenicola maris]
MNDVLAPGGRIGILGGGQLGRMLASAAARLGYSTHIYEPGACPAADVAADWTQASYEDLSALHGFAEGVDLITFEFENIPSSALDALVSACPVRPGRRALSTSQDRLVEKEFLSTLGLATAPYRNVESLADLNAAIDQIGTPAILKTRRFGYDGKGQVRIADRAEAEVAFAQMAGAPAILEGFVNFSHEVSVIVARNASGQVSCFDPAENLHRDGILRTSTVPARLSNSQQQDAILLAGRIATALDYIGVMGVELFVTPGALVVNEIAPRVHNSGHWTQNGCTIDQFEQHIRAITGLPLGDGRRHADVVMENLIGDDMDRLPALLEEPAAALHLYGKAEVRAGRKMGHVNRVTPLSPRS